MRTFVWLSCSVLSLTVAHAQPAPRTFEVAAIRPNPGPWHVIRGFTASGTALKLEGDTVYELILEAYGLKDYQLIVADSLPRPDGERYDIDAKAEGTEPPTRNEFRQMIQALLTSRFNLKFHRETRDVQVYALTVGKNGAKLRESDPATVFSGNHTVNGRNQTAILTHATMDMITDEILRSGLGRPVIDKTGLQGFYDIKLEATPEFRINNNPQPGDISLFTAIQDTLGLKLESQKAAVEVIVVDSFSKPTEN